MLSSSELKKIAQFICDKTGIVYSEESFFQLEKRVTQFSSDNNLPENNFLNFVVSDASLSSKFLELATNNESYFFRDPAAWDTFVNILIDSISQRGASEINGLFLGCSRGQEIYSLSILLAEQKKKIENVKISFSAFDFNSSVLSQAEKGIYSSLEVSRGVSATRLAAFFSKDENLPGNYIFKKEFRLSCTFKAFNLLTDTLPIGKFNFIVCRNVLIYQNEQSKKKILSEIYQALKPNGLLFLGGAEKILLANLGQFKERAVNSMCFYTK